MKQNLVTVDMDKNTIHLFDLLDSADIQNKFGNNCVAPFMVIETESTTYAKIKDGFSGKLTKKASEILAKKDTNEFLRFGSLLKVLEEISIEGEISRYLTDERTKEILASINKS